MHKPLTFDQLNEMFGIYGNKWTPVNVGSNLTREQTRYVYDGYEFKMETVQEPIRKFDSIPEY